MNSTAEIPRTVTRYQVDALLREAVGAASGIASSGWWSWRATAAMIELLVDPKVLDDPSQRAGLLDSGAALLNLKVLIRGLGVHPAVRLYPEPARRELVATVRLEGQHLVTDADRAMVAAVLSGEPRQPQEPSATTDPLITELRRAARTEQAWLAVQPLDALPPAGHAMSQNGNAAHQGGTALIIGTVLDGPGARLRAGQAAQRVTLTAATQGVSVTATKPDVLDTQTQRRTVRDLIGGGLWPQAVLHLNSDLPHQGPPTVQRAATRAEHPAT